MKAFVSPSQQRYNVQSSGSNCEAQAVICTAAIDIAAHRVVTVDSSTAVRLLTTDRSGSKPIPRRLIAVPA